MRIRDIFATTVQERIEPVVKVADRRPAVVQRELTNLVVTPQWEALPAPHARRLRRCRRPRGRAGHRHLDQRLLRLRQVAAYEGARRAAGGLTSSATGPPMQIFLSRLPATSPDRPDLDRFLRTCANRISTTAVGGNLHSMLADPSDSLALLTFKLFSVHQGYTHNWPLAWAVEHQIDARLARQDFAEQAQSLAGSSCIDPRFKRR